MLQRWKTTAKTLKREIHALYLACRDRRTPWYAKAVGLCLVGYALSPIDLIPDPIPVLGLLDDLVILPLGVLLMRRLVPAEVLTECRQRAESQAARPGSRNWIAGGIIIAAWIAALGLIAWWLWRVIG